MTEQQRLVLPRQDDADPPPDCDDTSALLAALVRRSSTAMLDETTRDLVRRRVFDTLGAGVAASGTLATAHRAMARRLTGHGGSDPLQVIRELCSIIRSSEVDDIHVESCITAGAAIVPVALVLAATHELTDDVLARSILAGYEVMVRLGLAIDGAEVLRAGVWPSYLLAPLGAAAVAACAFGLSEHQARQAMAISAARATGPLPRSVGEPSGRWLAFGSAAVDGVLAAAAAAEGFQVDISLVENRLANAGGGRFTPSRLTPSRRWAAAELDVKPFCTARQAQAAVEASWRACGGMPAGEVESIRLEVPEAYAAMIDRPEPRHRLESISSAQYQVATALAHPSALDDVLRATLHTSPAMEELTRTITVEPAADLSRLYPTTWGARATIRSKAGHVTTCEVLHPRGSAGAGGASWADLEEKQERIGVPRGTRESVLRHCRQLGATTKDGSSRTAALLLEATALMGGG